MGVVVKRLAERVPKRGRWSVRTRRRRRRRSAGTLSTRGRRPVGALSARGRRIVGSFVVSAVGSRVSVVPIAVSPWLLVGRARRLATHLANLLHGGSSCWFHCLRVGCTQEGAQRWQTVFLPNSHMRNLLRRLIRWPSSEHLFGVRSLLPSLIAYWREDQDQAVDHLILPANEILGVTLRNG